MNLFAFVSSNRFLGYCLCLGRGRGPVLKNWKCIHESTEIKERKHNYTRANDCTWIDGSAVDAWWCLDNALWTAVPKQWDHFQLWPVVFIAWGGWMSQRCTWMYFVALSFFTFWGGGVAFTHSFMSAASTASQWIESQWTAWFDRWLRSGATSFVASLSALWIPKEMLK